MNPSIEEVVQEAGAWADINGVQAVGQGRRDGRDCIEVLVSTPEAASRIPSSFKGYPVFVERSEPIQAHQTR